MVNKIRDAFNGFVADCLKHEPDACMNDFSIEINGAMAREIDKSLADIQKGKTNQAESYSLCGVKIIIHQNFGKPIMPPEPPLIWFLCRRYRHGKFCTIDENGNVVSVVGHVECVDPEPEPGTWVFYDMELKKNEK